MSMKKHGRQLSFASIILAIAAVFVMSGCGETIVFPAPDLNVIEGGAVVGQPELPVMTAVEDGFAFTDDVDLGNSVDVQDALDSVGDASRASRIRPVISFTWTGANTEYFNIFWSESIVRPATPQRTGIRDTVYFVRDGLLPNTEYFFWIEAVNRNGTRMGDMFNRSTRNIPHLQVPVDNGATGTLERGDFPRNVRIEAGDGQLTVWWNLADRVGWHEIYFVRASDMPNALATHMSGFPLPRAGSPWAGSLGGGLYAHNPLPLRFSDHAETQPGGRWTGFDFTLNDGLGRENVPALGYNQFGLDDTATWPMVNRPPAGSFPFIGEFWWEGEAANALGRLVPYQTLRDNNHPGFARFAANAIPWDNVNQVRGTPGQPIPHWQNHVTITGLTNDETYHVWIRVPNVNGERGFMVIEGTPGTAPLPVPGNISVETPYGTTRDLLVRWDSVVGVQGLNASRITGRGLTNVFPTAYRVYFSQFNERPGSMTPFVRVNSERGQTIDGVLITDEMYIAGHSYDVTFPGLLPNMEYFVWVVAELEGVAGAMGYPMVGMTGMPPATGTMRPRLDLWGNPIRTLVYVEVNDHSPLNAGSYILEDGTFLFDYVVIFAANIRNRNCAAETDIHGCHLSGVHLHFNENVRHILTNRSTFIQPLQDKGIRVLLGLLGDWDGIGFGAIEPGEAAIFIEQVRNAIEFYQLDGVDFDDEWASRFDDAGWVGTGAGATPSPFAISTYPHQTVGWAPSGTAPVFRNPTMGVVEGNMQMTDPGVALRNTMWLQSGRTLYEVMRMARTALNTVSRQPQTIAMYEFGAARWVTPIRDAEGVVQDNVGIWGRNPIDQAVGTAGPGTPALEPARMSTVTMQSLAELVDVAMQPWYNQWHWDSANWLPRSMFSPLAIDVGGHAYAGQNGSPNPTFPGQETFGGARPISISTVADNFRSANSSGDPNQIYGWMFFYGLNPASHLLRLNPTAPATLTKEYYLSYLTVPIFGQRVILTADGGNFQRTW